jgi:hypothetical protein
MRSPQAVVAFFLQPLGILVNLAEFQHAAASGRNSLFPWSTPGYLRVFACLDSRVLGHRRHF